ncbi:MAG: hypothetical protein N3J91_06600 [Verrucomicrobiae bacterium]|nr:hypothetical protein [Verrucomicrobiae bacterium]
MHRPPRRGRGSRPWSWGAVLLGLLPLLLCPAAAPDAPAGDAWVEGTPVYPQPGMVPATNGFDTLRCEGIAGKLKVSWSEAALPTNATVVLWHSLDAPGHWPARAWRTTPLTRRPDTWDVSVPVPHLDVPLVYFLAVTAPGQPTRFSPMRVCHPRAAGLEEIARPFWPFLEGFEEGLDNWRWHSHVPAGHALSLHTNAYNGYAALCVALPPQRRRVAVATTVVRGWHLDLFNARGLGLWARTLEGRATLRWAFIADGGTTNQQVFTVETAHPLDSRWTKIETLFDVIPPEHRGRLDTVTLEMESDAPRAVLLDNLHLLGRWRLELE